MQKKVRKATKVTTEATKEIQASKLKRGQGGFFTEKMKTEMVAMILAGGQGTRLGKLTKKYG